MGVGLSPETVEISPADIMPRGDGPTEVGSDELQVDGVSQMSPWLTRRKRSSVAVDTLLMSTTRCGDISGYFSIKHAGGHLLDGLRFAFGVTCFIKLSSPLALLRNNSLVCLPDVDALCFVATGSAKRPNKLFLLGRAAGGLSAAMIFNTFAGGLGDGVSPISASTWSKDASSQMPAKGLVDDPPPP